MFPRRISILGVGLLGGSIGLAAKQRLNVCEVIGYAHREETRRQAIRLGAVDKVTSSAAEAVAGADLVILCTPVGLFEDLLIEIAPVVSPQAIVTDVGSTKRSAAVFSAMHLSRQERFVGSHPMAGSEKRGVEAAKATLFDGATCILTPTAGTDRHALGQVEQFWKTLGMRVTQLSPEEHDRRLAEVSHLPHAVAAALIAMQDDGTLPLAGKGFLDATRIAGGDGGLWRDIFVDNRDNLRAAIQKLQANLEGLLACLEPGNADALKQWLDKAAARRQAMLDQRAKPANPPVD